MAVQDENRGGKMTSSLPEATVSHQTARRLRLHIPRRRRDAQYFARIRDELSKCEGVERVEANPSTASVLIHHHSTKERVADFAEDAELFAVALEDAPLSSNSLASQMNEFVGMLNGKLATATKGTLDLTSISALGLTIGAVTKAIKTKKFLPSSADMIWWAVTLLARHDARQRGDAVASAPPPAAEGTSQGRRRSVSR